MEIEETLYVVDRRDWRRWLEANFESAREIWLVYPNKASGEGRGWGDLARVSGPYPVCSLMGSA